MVKMNKSKFVFSETFNNKDGKTSGSGFMGIILGLVGGLCFIAAMIGWFLELPDVTEIMGKIVLILTLSAGLLGIRKISGTVTGVSVGQTEENKKEEEKG